MKRSLLLFVLPFFMISCNQNNRSRIPGGDDIALSWEFLGNSASERYYDAKWVLENRGLAVVQQLWNSSQPDSLRKLHCI